MNLLLILKSAVVIVFLVMFLRRPNVTWAIGLLTATSAVLLDAFLGTFGRDEMLSDLGFFFYIISGALFGGAATWSWGLLRPLTVSAPRSGSSTQAFSDERAHFGKTAGGNSAEIPADEAPSTLDRQMLFDQIRLRFGRDDVLDLIFDLGMNENDVLSFNQDMNQLILNVMDKAIQQGQEGPLSLAVERILTPPPAEYLPRLEKISADSPPTILRHYLLSHYDLEWVENAAVEMNIDWELLEGSSKKQRIRSLLLYLFRRNRIGELIALMQGGEPLAAGEEVITSAK